MAECFYIDTNVVSELRKAKSGKADQNVEKWVQDIPRSELFISVITILELETGVLKMERRDANQGAILRKWLDDYVHPLFPGQDIDSRH